MHSRVADSASCGSCSVLLRHWWCNLRETRSSSNVRIHACGTHSLLRFDSRQQTAHPKIKSLRCVALLSFYFFLLSLSSLLSQKWSAFGMNLLRSVLGLTWIAVRTEHRAVVCLASPHWRRFRACVKDRSWSAVFCFRSWFVIFLSVRCKIIVCVIIYVYCCLLTLEMEIKRSRFFICCGWFE